MEIKHIELSQANQFVSEHHRHHRPVTGHRFSLAVQVNERIVGVAIVGRPVARGINQSSTVEVLRLCTDGTPNACSKLYAAARRAAAALGYERIITYILDSEPGTSLKASGWHECYRVPGRSWSCQSRPRQDKHPTVDKRLYEAVLTT